MRHICLKYGLLLASLLLAAPSVGAQQLGQVLQQGLSSIEKQQWIIAGQVKNLRGEPVANARIQVHYASEGISQHSLEASFQGKYSLTLELDTIAYTTLTVTVSAQKAGYLPAREIVTFNKRGVTYPIDLVMLPEKPDVTTFPPGFLSRCGSFLFAERPRQSFPVAFGRGEGSSPVRGMQNHSRAGGSSIWRAGRCSAGIRRGRSRQVESRRRTKKGQCVPPPGGDYGLVGRILQSGGIIDAGVGPGAARPSGIARVGSNACQPKELGSGR